MNKNPIVVGHGMLVNDKNQQRTKGSKVRDGTSTEMNICVRGFENETDQTVRTIIISFCL